MVRNIIALNVVAILILFVGVRLTHAQAPPNNPSDQLNFHNDSWHLNVSPYLWFAGANGVIGFAGREVRIDQSFTDILSNLKFGVTGLSEVRRGRIGLLTDLMYFRLGDERAIPVEGLSNDINVKASLDTFTLSPYFSYRIFGSERGSIDFLAGGRYYHIGSTITAVAGAAGKVSLSTSDNWADLVGGGRLTLNLTPRIRTFFIGDAGGGGSVLTYQFVGGVGYQWNKRWSTALGYRRLYFNRQPNSGLDIEPTQQGLVLGATIRFR